MKFFRIITLFAVALFLSIGAMAQTDSTAKAAPLTPEQRANKQTISMSKHLLLSPDQIEQVKSINLKYAQLRQTDVRTEHQERRANMEQRNIEMEKILNPAQYQKYLQLERRSGKGLRNRERAMRNMANQPKQPAQK